MRRLNYSESKKVKKILIAMIIAVATLHGYAQNAAGNFLPRANDDIEELHELIHGQGYDYHQIEELVIEYFGK